MPSDEQAAVETATHCLTIRLFGTMEVTLNDGTSLLPPLRKTKAILALLALSGVRPVSREQIVGLLWSKRDRDHAHASLRQCVYQLRDLLQPLQRPLLRAERNTLALETADIWIDAAILRRATRTRPEALDLLRGPLLQDLVGLDPAFDRWLDAERQRFATLARNLAENILNHETEPAGIIAAAERLLRIDEGHEGGWRALMSAYARLGQTIAAVQAFERCVGVLSKAANVSPSQETVALMSQIREHGTASMSRPLASVIHSAPPAARSGPMRLGVMQLRAINRSSEELADGLAEEITTALTRFRSLTCLMPAGRTPIYQEADLRQVLDVDFLVEGSVQHSITRSRVVLRLRDMARDGEVVWSQRFQGESSDLLALQDEIASQTVAQINSELLLLESGRLERQPPEDPTASQLLLRGIRAIFRLEKRSFLKAGELLAAAVAREPGHAAAHAWWAYWHVLLLGQGWAEDPDAATALTWDLTRRAIALDPNDAHALTLAGHVRAFTHRRLEDAMTLHERALSINPNLPLAWLFSGLAHTYCGQHGEAIRRIRRARQLSPLDPHGFFFDMALTLAHMLNGENEFAIAAGRTAAATNPEFSAAFKATLATLGHLDRPDERNSVLGQLLTLEPSFTVTDAMARSPLARQEDRERFADGLLRAGLPK